MKLGILSDIHGDLRSLDIALKLFADHKVNQILCAGDTVEGGPQDGNVLVRLQENAIPCVQGNHDENAVRHAEMFAFTDAEYKAAEACQTLDEKSLAYLRNLPLTESFTFGSVSLLLAHATPSNNGAAIFLSSRHDVIEKKFKKDLSRMSEEILIVGHTHFPFDLRFQDKRVLNPGAVCQLSNRDSHTCAVFDLIDNHFSVLALPTGTEVDIRPLEF
ncbi:MAG TPA: hypothetical protein DD473_20640 [Planctomycetaceae bacterium]|nr:hypothetical protein [Planctomycetaceae bacterium]|tara:strand:- start:964 stop:1614 length:651 start_codon:yes stop_codon:yes gene_type:complete